MQIIDFHTHLGDILDHNGGALIGKKDIKKATIFDTVSLSEFFSHAIPGSNLNYKLMGNIVTRAERARNATATLENFEHSAELAGIAKSICLPIPPYLTFDDLHAACQQSKQIIPFTGVDFSMTGNWRERLDMDVQTGAKGLKLHPNIQKVSLEDERTYEVIEAFKEHKLPVLFHCGVSSYYLGKDKQNEAPEFGQIHYAQKLVKHFPDVSFVAGHAGLFQVDDVIDQLASFDNVWVDTSFQPAKKIKQLLHTFGEDKILFGSDWPFGSRKTAVKIMKKVCSDNYLLAQKVFHENAEYLMGIKP